MEAIVEKRRPTKREGFTLIELLTVISIVVLLMAILLTALGRAREQARQVQCANNLRQLGMALSMYADAYQDWIPQAANHREPNSPENWHQNPQFTRYLGLPSNLQERSVITCPSHRDPGRNTADFLDDDEMELWISYGMNVAFGSCRTDAHQRRRRIDFRQPALTMAFMDAYAYGNAIGEVGWQSCLSPCDAYRHNGYAQVLFLDQHVGQTAQLVHSCSEEDIDFAFWGCYWLKP
jgi:prepilin-type N-terminal cleavage/methylation domain-containing protein/prepilin-type processing-associated H-X9-DG protein